MTTYETTARDARPLLLFFRAERSGQARRMDSLVAHLARKERARLRVAVVDVDERPDLARRFGVRGVPALVLVKERRVAGRLDGRASAPKIERMLEPHLGVVTAGERVGELAARPAIA